MPAGAPSAVTTVAATLSLSTSSQTAIVQPGDTLSGLALRFGVSVASLASLNGLQNDNALLAGQTLKVPVRSQAAAASGPATAAPSLPGDATYIVQPGDTLSGLALRYGVSPGTLAELNGLTNQDRLLANTTLRVPTQPTAPDAGS